MTEQDAKRRAIFKKMSIGIYFVSKYGQTRKIAQFLTTQFGNLGLQARSIDVSDVSSDSTKTLEFDALLIGAPVYQGSYPSAVRRFIENHRRELLTATRTGFFSTCLAATPGTADSYRESLVPVRKFLDDVAWTPQWIATFPGALNYREYTPVVRWVLKRISVQSGGPGNTSKDHELTRWDEVARFAEQFANDAGESEFRATSVPLATRVLNVLMPEYEHRLVQRLAVRATPDQVGAALKSLERADMPFAEWLAGVRDFGKPNGNPPPDLFHAAEAFGGTAIDTGQPHEVAGGLVGQFWKRDYGIRRVPDAASFQEFSDPEYSKALTNFWFDEFRDGKTVIRTETRIHSLGPAAQRSFRVYWFVVGLGIRLYMSSILRGVRRAAARGAWNPKIMAAQ